MASTRVSVTSSILPFLPSRCTMMVPFFRLLSISESERTLSLLPDVSISSIPVSFVSKYTVAPMSIIAFRIFFITLLRTSVPIWGLASYNIFSGAPNFTKVSSTKELLPALSLTNVFNLPSEKVPAPPSPN